MNEARIEHGHMGPDGEWAWHLVETYAVDDVAAWNALLPRVSHARDPKTTAVRATLLDAQGLTKRQAHFPLSPSV